MRRLLGCAVVLSLAAVPFAAPSAALAQGTPPNPLAPFPQVTTPTATAPPPVVQPTTTTAPGDSSFSSSSVLGIVIGAIVVLGGISLFIWRDARRRAPVRRRPAAATAGDGRTTAKQRVKPRKLSPAERRRRKRGRAR